MEEWGGGGAQLTEEHLTVLDSQQHGPSVSASVVPSISTAQADEDRINNKDRAHGSQNHVLFLRSQKRAAHKT